MKSNYVFPRRDILKLSGLDSNALSYLEKTGIVEGKEDLTSKRTVKPKFYTFQQLIELRAIKKLRETISLQKLRVAKEYLKELGETDYLGDKTIIAEDNKIYWIDTEKFSNFMLEIAGKNQGQFHFTFFTVSVVLEEIGEVAKEKEIDISHKIPKVYQSLAVA